MNKIETYINKRITSSKKMVDAYAKQLQLANENDEDKEWSVDEIVWSEEMNKILGEYVGRHDEAKLILNYIKRNKE